MTTTVFPGWRLGGSFTKGWRRATLYARSGRNTGLQTLASSSKRARVTLHSNAKGHQRIAKDTGGDREYFGQSDRPDFSMYSVGQPFGQGLDNSAPRLKSALDQIHRRLRDA
jgi:hypothetical protein